MKRSLMVLSLLALSNLANAASLTDIVGSYKISSPDLPILNVVTINAKGAVKLTEQSPYGTIDCKGKATIASDVLSSDVTCTNGQTFTQKINLKGVKNYSKFSAPVYSSLYEQEIVMNFERL